MIGRIWHGWTSLENADAYEELLKSEIFVGIAERKFAVRAFAGQDYEVAVVPPKARALLARFDARSQHYEIKAEIK